MTPAEAGFDDRDIDVRRCELRQRCRRQQLELRCVDAFGRGTDTLDCGVEVSLGAANADALAPATYVRREVGADREAFAREQFLGRARDRRLAVRADDVDRRVAQLRIAELGEERLDAVETEPLLRPGAQRLDELSRRGHRALAGSA